MSCKLAISSMSLGRGFAGHTLARRLDMARKYDFRGIEIFYEDLIDLAAQLSPMASHEVPGSTLQLTAARIIGEMCRTRGLDIISLQPFMHYEGLRDRLEQANRLRELELWIDLVHAMGTDLILIPSTFLPADQVCDDIDVIVADLRMAADLGLRSSPPVRFAYESLCWGTRVDVWERCWHIVKEADRSNLGICLDTFNIAGRVYADPARPSGTTANAENAMRKSIARLVSEVNVQKVFLLQVVDAERLDRPLIQGHAFFNDEQPARMSWSRNCRLFYGEKDRGAYLPVKEICSAVIRGLGYHGWVSFELFNRRMAEKDAQVPEELARRGAASWTMLSKDLDLSMDGDSTRPLALL